MGTTASAAPQTIPAIKSIDTSVALFTASTGGLAGFPYLRGSFAE
jgi:hypothetical protein